MLKHAITTVFLLLQNLLLWASPPDTARFEQTLCAEDSLFVFDDWYHIGQPSGFVLIPQGSQDGSDSIIVIDLQFYPPAESSYRDTFCASQTVLLFGRLFSPATPSAEVVLPNASIMGCDSIIHVELIFGAPAAYKIKEEICPGDTIFVDGTAYHHGFYLGVELLEQAAAGGCDSLIEIDLNPIPNAFNVLRDTLYEGEFYAFNGENFDVERPNADLVFPNMAENGCDSIVQLRLFFYPPPQSFAYIPNVFQPNSENPQNTMLSVGLHQDVSRIRTAQVFDRWGGLVFSEKNVHALAWDGTWKRKGVQEGVYLLVLELEMKDGSTKKEEGTFTLIR